MFVFLLVGCVNLSKTQSTTEGIVDPLIIRNQQWREQIAKPKMQYNMDISKMRLLHIRTQGISDPIMGIYNSRLPK